MVRFILVGYDIQQRIENLKDNYISSSRERVKLFYLFFKYNLLIILAFFLLSFITETKDTYKSYSSTSEQIPGVSHSEETSRRIIYRSSWLDNWPIGISGDYYSRFSQSLYESITGNKLLTDPLLLSKEKQSIKFNEIGFLIKTFSTTVIRLLFLIFAFGPAWILSLIAGYYLCPLSYRNNKLTNFLGILDKKTTPFYSGIYAKLKINEKTNEVDLSVPSLACPKLFSKTKTINHDIIKILKKYLSYNETNLELSRIILEYKDFPSLVEGENIVEDHKEEGDNKKEVWKEVFIDNLEGTIEEASLKNLESTLSAFFIINSTFEKIRSLNLQPSYENYNKYLLLNLENASEETKIFALSLTIKRAKALALLKPEIIATCVLAIEAGKVLFFKREKSNLFSKLSKYPHLQSRAILQSVESYHEEYDGKIRATIRQAIISSRRHGDFGRAFLPYNMSTQSHALRDWLEIIYSSKESKSLTAQVVELDAHLHEIHHSWQCSIKKSLLNLKENPENKNSATKHQIENKGLVYKSVVLLPLERTANLALKGLGSYRFSRILNLMEDTRVFQTTISVSARLPGLRRQALETWQDRLSQDGIASYLELQSPKNWEEILKMWVIIRRMLTKYNWLSTRVGDDAVPQDGLVQGVVIDRLSTKERPIIKLEALVPLRQRRFTEIFGSNWENSLYYDNPHPNDIRISVSPATYKKNLSEASLEAKKRNLEKI